MEKYSNYIGPLKFLEIIFMSQSQTGIKDSPGKHRLILILTIEDMPLTAMSIAKIGAMTPQLCSQVSSERPEAKLRAMVGFGPQLWSLILLDSYSSGFKALKSTDESPYTGGDFLLYFSSSSAAFNRELAQNVIEYAQSMTEDSEKIEGVACETAAPLDIDDENIFLGNQNPELEQSSFAYVRRWRGGEVQQASQPESPHTLNHIWRNADLEEPEICTVQFSAKPSVFKDCSKTQSWGKAFAGSVFILPSLDLLTGLRMGGLRMGLLSPTAIWKNL